MGSERGFLGLVVLFRRRFFVYLVLVEVSIGIGFYLLCFCFCCFLVVEVDRGNRGSFDLEDVGFRDGKGINLSFWEGGGLIEFREFIF